MNSEIQLVSIEKHNSILKLIMNDHKSKNALSNKMILALKNAISSACNDKSIKVLEIQREGKRQQKIEEFVLGSKITKGSNLNNA